MSAARVLYPSLTTHAPLCRVVDVERELKSALSSTASRARQRSVELGCELVYGVGGTVLGDSRDIRRIVTAATRALADFQGDRGELWLRIARRFAGFDATTKVLVSLTSTDGQRSAPFELDWARVEEVEIAPMPLSVLIVTPSLRSGRVLEQSAVQAGVHATVAADVEEALERFDDHDAVLVDDVLSDRGLPLVRAMHDLGAKVLVATATRDSFERAAYITAGAEVLVDKPVMPADIAALGLEPPASGRKMVRAGTATMIPR